MTAERDIYRAIADPTRRAILGLLMGQPLTMNLIAQEFAEISRPAVSKHVKMLIEAGLINVRQMGRERFCYLRPEGLQEVAQWVAQYEVFWMDRMDRLDGYLQQKYPPERKEENGSEKE